MAKQAFHFTQNHPIYCIQVSDQQAIQACVDLADDFRVLVEPACGAAYATLYSPHPNIKQAKTIVVVICGGSGVNSDVLCDWKNPQKGNL